MVQFFGSYIDDPPNSPGEHKHPSQPVTARAGGCVMSTWAPWGPTGSASIGDVTVLIVRSLAPTELIVIILERQREPR